MDSIHSEKTVEPEVPRSRPWGLALLSGAVFGGLAAAAANWLGLHSQPLMNRGRVNFGRKWATGVSGVAAGAVAMYGTLHAPDEAPPGVHNEVPTGKIHAAEAEHKGHARIPSPGERSL